MWKCRACARSLLCWLAACGGADEPETPAFRVIAESQSSALMSVHGTSARDVWLVGADGGDGPLVLHWDGAGWQRLDTGAAGDLWWVHVLPSGVVHFAGSGGLLLEYRDGAFEQQAAPPRMDAEDAAEPIAFGLWAAAEQDVYAVGMSEGSGGFLWHHDGEVWVELELPADLPRGESGLVPGLFKVWGTSGDDVWIVGENGLVLRGNARAGFTRVASGTEERLFTVHASAARLAMVGGASNGYALELAGERLDPVTPPGAGPLQGVNISEAGAIWAVGVGGAVFHRPAPQAEWKSMVTGFPVQSLHAVWADPDGGVWMVGGRVLTLDLDYGLALHYALAGSEVPSATTPNSP